MTPISLKCTCILCKHMHLVLVTNNTRCFQNHYHYHIRFNVYFPCLHGLDGFLWETSKYLSLARYLLTFLSFWSLLMTSFDVFPSGPVGKLPPSFKVLYLLDQALSPIFSRWPNHSSLISCEDYLMLFNFSLILSFFCGILFSDVTLHIHLTIIKSFLFSLSHHLFNWSGLSSL